MDLLASFLNFIERGKLFRRQDHLLVAVSGGVDSVVLAHLCAEAGFLFSIAHCNFKLRHSESDADAAFVRGLAAKLQVPYYEKEFDTQNSASTSGRSIQETARELRYAWFHELSARINGTAHSPLPIHHSPILTAHHADDAAETMLLNFFKGTGIAGLHGIRPLQGSVARPLLFAHREEIIGYARGQGLEWREDSSNAESKYTRNAIRNELLPQIEKYFPQVRRNLAANAERFSEVEQIYREAVAAQLNKMRVTDGAETRVPVRRLKDARPLDTILWELSRPFGFTTGQIAGLRALLDSPPGRYLSSPTHQAIRHGQWLLFAPIAAPDNRVHVIDKDAGSIAFGDQLLFLSFEEQVPSSLDTGSNTVLLDAGAIDFPLVLRRWKAGDYFYPLGMRKKKKLARFFIDSKLSKSEKEQVWVLESHKRIVWVAGHRIDDRFRITPGTRKVLRLELRRLSDPGNAGSGK